MRGCGPFGGIWLKLHPGGRLVGQPWVDARAGCGLRWGHAAGRSPCGANRLGQHQKTGRLIGQRGRSGAQSRWRGRRSLARGRRRGGDGWTGGGGHVLDHLRPTGCSRRAGRSHMSRCGCRGDALHAKHGRLHRAGGTFRLDVFSQRFGREVSVQQGRGIHSWVVRTYTTAVGGWAGNGWRSGR